VARQSKSQREIPRRTEICLKKEKHLFSQGTVEKNKTKAIREFKGSKRVRSAGVKVPFGQRASCLGWEKGWRGLRDKRGRAEDDRLETGVGTVRCPGH